MSTELATRPANLPALHMDEGELLAVLKNSLFPGAKDESIKMVIGWCKAAGKDPLKRPVHIVPMSVLRPGTRDTYDWRDVIMPGIGDYRIDASRTGEYAGIEEAKFGADKAMKIQDGEELTYPEWCEVTVYRMVRGVRCPFSSGKVRWLESYATNKRGSVLPNAMWKKRPYGQLEKCAEALALRRAFPEVGSSPTADEMEGKPIETFDGATVDAASGQVEMPRSKAEPKVEPETKPAAETEPAGTTESGQAETSPVEKPAGPLANAGMMRVVRAKLKNAGKTEEQMAEHFGYDVDHMPAGAANDVMAWASAQ